MSAQSKRPHISGCFCMHAKAKNKSLVWCILWPTLSPQTCLLDSEFDFFYISLLCSLPVWTLFTRFVCAACRVLVYVKREKQECCREYLVRMQSDKITRRFWSALFHYMLIVIIHVPLFIQVRWRAYNVRARTLCLAGAVRCRKRRARKSKSNVEKRDGDLEESNGGFSGSSDWSFVFFRTFQRARCALGYWLLVLQNWTININRTKESEVRRATKTWRSLFVRSFHTLNILQLPLTMYQW